MLKVIIAIAFVVLSISAYAEGIRNCTSCHKIEKIDKIHNLSCIECHVLKENRNNVYSHEVVIKNPSSFEYVDRQCARCHKSDIERVKNSLHGTLSSAINITRFVWHAQGSYKPIYGIFKTKHLKAIPQPKDKIKNPADLVDDLLRRKCLRCHIQNNSFGTVGTYRAKGCAACHMEYSKFGRYEGMDAIVYGKKGFSKTHRFFRHPKMSSCLSCHNNEFVGSDYVGLFPQDYDKSFRSPIEKSGYFKMRLYGIGQHHLSSDIHFKKGLTCVDCHKKSDVMGDHKLYERELDAIKISCADCHGGYNKKPNSRFVRNIGDVYIFKSVNGKNYKVSQFNETLDAHKYHKNVSCSACHSLWQSNHFQLNLYLDKTKNYAMWKNLIYQEDPYLEQFLRKALKNPSIKPTMPDYIDNKLKSGIWYSGWLARRWMPFVLVKDKDGMYRIGRPLFQYRLTYKDENGRIVFDDVNDMAAIVPYSPHTISLYGKSCQQCHNNKFMFEKNALKGSIEELFFQGKVLFGRMVDNKSFVNIKKYNRIRFEELKGFFIDVNSK